MKRIGNVYAKICRMENLVLADQKARQHKTCTRGVRAFDRNRDANLLKLQLDLLSGTYHTSKYHVFTVYEPKERLIYELPYYPDRILHHAIMNVVGEMFQRNYAANTYSSIKGKGGMRLHDRMIKVLKNDPEGTRYCLSLDIRKYFPSIDHDHLKMLIRRKIKDTRLLALLDEIIDSADGLPIGNYLSQTFANFYLSELDHMYANRHYFRYTDNIVVLAADKDTLHNDFDTINAYMHYAGVRIKGNWQIFPVESRGIDIVGFRFYHGKTLLRKKIKKHIIAAGRKVHEGNADRNKALGGYCGWLIYTNSINLNNKYKILWKQKALSH